MPRRASAHRSSPRSSPTSYCSPCSRTIEGRRYCLSCFQTLYREGALSRRTSAVPLLLLLGGLFLAYLVLTFGLLLAPFLSRGNRSFSSPPAPPTVAPPRVAPAPPMQAVPSRRPH